DRLQQDLRRDQVLVERREEAVRRGGAGRSARRPTTVVDEDLHGVGVRGRLHLRAQRRVVGHVGGDGGVLLARMHRRQRRERGIVRLGRAREQGHVGAERRQLRRGRATAALRATADEGVLC